MSLKRNNCETNEESEWSKDAAPDAPAVSLPSLASQQQGDKRWHHFANLCNDDDCCVNHADGKDEMKEQQQVEQEESSSAVFSFPSWTHTNQKEALPFASESTFVPGIVVEENQRDDNSDEASKSSDSSGSHGKSASGGRAFAVDEKKRTKHDRVLSGAFGDKTMVRQEEALNWLLVEQLEEENNNSNNEMGHKQESTALAETLIVDHDDDDDDDDHALTSFLSSTAACVPGAVHVPGPQQFAPEEIMESSNHGDGGGGGDGGLGGDDHLQHEISPMTASCVRFKEYNVSSSDAYNSPRWFENYKDTSWDELKWRMRLWWRGKMVVWVRIPKDYRRGDTLHFYRDDGVYLGSQEFMRIPCSLLLPPYQDDDWAGKLSQLVCKRSILRGRHHHHQVKVFLESPPSP